MLFVKKKAGTTTPATRDDTEALERIDTPEAGVEVLAPRAPGPRQPAHRGLFVRPARDVTDVLELGAPTTASASAEPSANASPRRQPDASDVQDEPFGLDPEPTSASEEPREVSDDTEQETSRQTAQPGKAEATRKANPLLAALVGWRAKALEKQAGAVQAREAKRQAKAGAPAKKDAKKDASARDSKSARNEQSSRSKGSSSDAEKNRRPNRLPFSNRNKRKGPETESLLLATEFEGGRTVFWRMSDARLEQLDDEPAGTAFSFSSEDRRFVVETGLSRRAAQDLAMMEIGEPVSLVNASKEHHALYATRFARATGFTTLLAPGLQALDALLKRAERAPRNLVTGFLLKGEQDRTLALLYHVDAQGEIGALQVTANPENMDFTLAQFVASRRITPEDHDVVLFDNADLLSVAHLAQSYPVEPVIAGLALSRVLQLGAATSLALALASAGWAGWQYSQGVQLQARIQLLQSNIKSDTLRNGEFLRSSLPSFAQAMTLDTAAQLARAQSLWLPGTTLTLQSTQEESRYQLVMPVVRGERVGMRPSVASRLTVEELVGLVDFTPPEECHREELAVQGALNELKVTIVCQDADTALAGYRLD
jgi:hypothetical protein